MELDPPAAGVMNMEPVLFRWPMGEGKDPFPVQALQLLQRPDRLLMAFPSEAISDAMLDAWAEQSVPGEESLVGVRARFFVPTFFAVAAPERSVEELVLDMASPPADSMIVPFSEEQPEFPFATTFLEEGVSGGGKGHVAHNLFGKFGGFGQNKELGLVMWALARIFNHASRGNLLAAQDHVALLAVMLEQAALDGGQWQVAWLLGLLEGFWRLPAMGYGGPRNSIKENEILFSKRAEATKKAAQLKEKGPPGNPKPKPKQKCRPGGGQPNAPQQNQQASNEQQG